MAVINRLQVNLMLAMVQGHHTVKKYIKYMVIAMDLIVKSFEDGFENEGLPEDPKDAAARAAALDLMIIVLMVGPMPVRLQNGMEKA